jgi:hypothetical protein
MVVRKQEAGEHWGFDAVSEILILLAHCAAFDIFRDPGLSAGPEVFSIDASDCFISSGMTIDGAFVPHVH